MPMNGAQLGSEMLTAVEGALGITLEGEQRDEAMQALGEAIVNHIISNAQVIVAGGSSAGTYTVL